MRKKLLVLLVGSSLMPGMYAQYTTDKVMGEKNQYIADSLKKMDYPYIFPAWGKKVTAKGFNIPKSGGLSSQYLYQQSDIIIENLQVGFNHGPLYSLDQIIRFNSAVATSNGISFRPDVWVLPFLNVYGLVAQSNTSTEIDAGVWLPDDSSWKQITSLHTKANFKATTLGFGLTPTAGIRGFFLALDMNFSWSDIAELEKPAFVSVFGPRFGKNITLKKPDRNIAMWIGGFRVMISSGTSGSINAGDLLPTSEWHAKIDGGTQKLTENQAKVDGWWNGLTPAEQKNPVNIAKHDAANAALSTFGKVLNGASQIVSSAGNASIQYSLDKRQAQPWNFIVGSQYQISRSWMIRAEYGFLGHRQQFLGGVQYRFNF